MGRSGRVMLSHSPFPVEPFALGCTSRRRAPKGSDFPGLSGSENYSQCTTMPGPPAEAPIKEFYLLDVSSSAERWRNQAAEAPLKPATFMVLANDMPRWFAEAPVQPETFSCLDEPRGQVPVSKWPLTFMETSIELYSLSVRPLEFLPLVSVNILIPEKLSKLFLQIVFFTHKIVLIHLYNFPHQ